MAATPEGKVKAKLVKMLKELDVWYFFPAAGPMGRAGIPDVIAIVGGLFVGVECKADRSKKPTVLQYRVGKEIVQAGGEWFLVRSDDDIQQLRSFIMSKDVKKRVGFSFTDTGLQVRYDGDEMELSLPEELTEILALYGLRAFLQSKTLGSEDEKLVAIEKAYDMLVEEGEAAFERKSPVGRKVQFKKADKIMALAMLKGVTITAMKEVLANLDPAKVNKILDSEAVMTKLKEMQDEEIDLEV